MKQNIITNKWVCEQWEESELGDTRRNKRAIKLAISMINNPNSSLPTQTDDWADLKASYRLLNCLDVSHEKLQSRHWKNTIQKAWQTNKTTLFLQDTSELDYSSKKKTRDLGPIGDHRGKGLMMHTCLAVEYDTSCTSILGLAQQKVWRRDDIARRNVETRTNRLSRKNEGDLWEDCLAKISSIAGIVHPKWISVGDRGNDIFNFMRFCKNNQWKYVIRACQNRSIICQDSNKNFKLLDWARTLIGQTSKVVKISGQEEIELQIGWGKVKIRIPKNLISRYGREEIEVHCLRCWNLEKNLEWILLTNVAIENFSDALERIDWYAARWTIEEYHKCLKTGCSIEKRNLQTAHALKAILGILGIIATKLLDLKFKSRKNPLDLAMLLIDPSCLKIISLKFKILEEDMTIQQFWRCVARMGGFIGRKSDGDPGWQTLWKGWLRLLDMLSCADMFQKCG